MAKKEEILKLKNEKKNIISDYIKLKDEHQKNFFILQETIREIGELKIKLTKTVDEKNELEKKCLELESELKIHRDRNLMHENKNLEAKIKQLKRSSHQPATEESTGVDEFEVETILKHRKRKGKLQYLVRWKNYPPNHDSWQNESDLYCPEIFNQYIKENRL